jgi:hypothetical protein
LHREAVRILEEKKVSKKEVFSVRLGEAAAGIVGALAGRAKISKSEAIERLILASSEGENLPQSGDKIEAKLAQIEAAIERQNRLIFRGAQAAKSAELFGGAVASMGANEARRAQLKDAMEAARKRATDELMSGKMPR